MTPFEFDVFVSHASEDKREFVEPLVGALRGFGLRVWYDADEIQIGDDIRRRIEVGLANSQCAIVVLSPSFRKFWPEAELSALFQQEAAFGEHRILPVVHAMTFGEVTRLWPLVAARAAVHSSQGPAHIAQLVVSRLRRSQRPAVGGGSHLYNVARRSRPISLVANEKRLQSSDCC